MISLSLGLRHHVLAVGSMKDALSGKVIKLYSGAVPATANDAITGGNTLLCTISTGGDGTPLEFEATPVNGILVKDTSDEWVGTVLASGTATFYRFSAAADADGASTTNVRVQGSVAIVGGDLNLSNPTLVEDAVQRVTFFAITQPAQ